MYYLSENGSIENSKPQEASNKLFIGYANSLTDLDNDFRPDLLLNVQLATNKLGYEEWTMNNHSEYQFSRDYSAPDNVAVYGQSLFADFGNSWPFQCL